MWKAIYDSPWHHPAMAWAAGVAFLAWWMRRQPFLVAYVALFAVATLADATATGGWSPLLLLRSPLATPISIAFVILGDFRYFLLVERFAKEPEVGPSEATRPAAWATAAAFAFFVPVASTIARQVVHMPETRWTFLTYEGMFLVLALVLRFAILPRRLAPAPAPVRAWLLRVTSFEIAQYALWALADVVILGGADAGYLLRLVPNVMYYALFLPFVAGTAPAEAGA